jgi:diguanylate cyclase (GGDEF)-like protein/PAS domain S-box-containing protein
MEAGVGAILVIDGDDHIVLAGRGIEPIFGYVAESVVGLPLDALIPERLSYGTDDARASLDGPEDGPVGPTQEVLCVRGDGTTFPAELALGRFRTDDTTLIVATLRDITQQRALHQELGERAERYRTTLEVLEEGVVQYRIEGSKCVATVVNSAGLSLLGVGNEEYVTILTKGEWSAIDINGQALAGNDWPIPTAIRTGRPVKGAIVGIQRDEHSITWLRINATPSFDNSGGITRVVASASDVTDILASQKALDVVKNRFTAMVEHSSDLIAIIDAHQHLSYASPAFERVLQRRVCDYQGQPIWQFVHPDDWERLGDIFSQLAQQPGGAVTFECRLLHADGTPRHFVITQTNRLDDPAIQGFVGNGHDITDRVAVEASLEHRASHDVLTGLPNRSHFTDRLALAIDRSERSGETFCLYFLDLDGFKVVNDRYGHDVGDQLLVQVAARLREKARPADEVARLGGDEFVLLTEGVADEDAFAIRRRLEGTLEKPFEIAGGSIELRASVGYAVSSVGTNMQEILRAADRNMYDSKDPDLHT